VRGVKEIIPLLSAAIALLLAIAGAVSFVMRFSARPTMHTGAADQVLADVVAAIPAIPAAAGVMM
jgi:hypothetical protein